MIDSLAQRLSRLDSETDFFLNIFNTFSSVTVDLAPSSGGWSALNVAEHLIIVEEIIARGLIEKPNRLPAKKSLRDRALSPVVALYLRLGIRIKAPTPAILPTGTLQSDQVELRWQIARQALRTYLETLTPETARNTLMRHPIAGPLDALETLDFLRKHIAHHQKQLERIKHAIGGAY